MKYWKSVEKLRIIHDVVLSNILHFMLKYFKREQQEKCEGGRVNPALVNELKALRSHRTQLESHLISLQDSRKSLLGQLEGLMKLLKTSTHSQPQNNQSVPNAPPPLPPKNSSSTFFSTDSTPPSQSLKSSHAHSSVATMGSVPSLPSTNGGGNRSAPPTPSHTNHYSSLDSIPTDNLGSSGFSSLRSSCFGSLGHQGSLGHNTGSLGHKGSLGHSTGSLGHNQGLFGQKSSLSNQRIQNEDDQDGDLSPESRRRKIT
ncbi:Dystrobrevin alpha [Armadillidium nasatum]|uniref:Dystrobrevin alpha n=1 Tax=Armadillidium nasatum TaxID=96803 RepID=A0A5N5TI83_9CRUS|nr:Dystrobrevin alpha [Armadillidium nasatum]